MTDNRCWRYRAANNERGYEGRIFDHPDLVPENEGWTDSPANINKPAPPPPAAEDPSPAPVAAIPATRPLPPRPPKLPTKKA